LDTEAAEGSARKRGEIAVRNRWETFPELWTTGFTVETVDGRHGLSTSYAHGLFLLNVSTYRCFPHISLAYYYYYSLYIYKSKEIERRGEIKKALFSVSKPSIFW
ncbi:hypothetical protein LWX53_01400, partial [bacterium]|nr:hypothetical protein [bacterium]